LTKARERGGDERRGSDSTEKEIPGRSEKKDRSNPFPGKEAPFQQTKTRFGSNSNFNQGNVEGIERKEERPRGEEK